VLTPAPTIVAERRRAAAQAERRAVELEGRHEHVERAQALDWRRGEQAAHPLVRVVQDFQRGVVLGERHAGRLAFGDDVGHAPHLGPFADPGVDRRALAAALQVVRQRRIQRPVGAAQQFDQGFPLALFERQQLDVAVGAGQHPAVAERALDPVLHLAVAEALDGEGADRQRRVLAGDVDILAADVVGYSALMEADEAGTFDRVSAGRKELFEPEINKHHGRIFKLMGDGLLAEFGSVVDAVECAVTLQRGMTERNASVPEVNRFEIRIGINLGEVIVEGDDRYGEGVNVAARLQELADPGGICVSGKVSREVEKKLAFGFESIGEQQLKNIAEPIACYRVSLQLSPAVRTEPVSPTSRTPSKAPLPLPDKPSIAVLPFQNMSGDPEQDYFADGMVEEIITALSRVAGCS